MELVYKGEYRSVSNAPTQTLRNETNNRTGGRENPITWPLDKITIDSMALSRSAQCQDVYQRKFRDVNRN